MTSHQAACDSVDLTKAVLEGVAFSLRQGQDLLTDGETSLTSVGLIGGGSRSAYWSRLIATVLERPLAIFQSADFTAALGAARLAMMASGAGELHEVARRPFAIRTLIPNQPTRFLTKAIAQSLS